MTTDEFDTALNNAADQNATAMMNKAMGKRTIAADKAWLKHLGKVKKLPGERRYEVTLSDGTQAVARFFDLERLEVQRLKDGETSNFDYVPMDDVEEVRLFITARIETYRKRWL